MSYAAHYAQLCRDSLSPLRVMLVDDDPEFTDIFKFLMPDCTLLVAHDVEAASGILRAIPGLDAAIIDMQLPGGTGLDVLRGIKSVSKIPCIMVTGRPLDDKMVNEAMDLGAVAFMRKPSDCKPQFIDDLFHLLRLKV